MLVSQRINEDAMADKSLFEDGMLHKKAFYNASYANYDKCLSGNFQLLPNNSEMNALRNDYLIMVNAGMFSTKPMEFNEIITIIETLQIKLKQIITQ